MIRKGALFVVCSARPVIVSLVPCVVRAGKPVAHYLAGFVVVLRDDEVAVLFHDAVEVVVVPGVWIGGEGEGGGGGDVPMGEEVTEARGGFPGG